MDIFDLNICINDASFFTRSRYDYIHLASWYLYYFNILNITIISMLL
jgi:hypothetical protein